MQTILSDGKVKKETELERLKRIRQLLFDDMLYKLEIHYKRKQEIVKDFLVEVKDIDRAINREYKRFKK